MSKGNYKIIVESGATKSAWRILDAEGNIVREFFRMGGMSLQCGWRIY